MIERRGQAPVLGGPKVEALTNRADLLNEVLPALRGAVSQNRPMVLHVDDSPAVLEFVNARDSRDLAERGRGCPDHLVSTKVVPYQRLDGWQRRGAARRPGAGAAAYARSYAEYFERFRDPKDAMDDPYPRVILVPGIGMVTTGKNKDTAIAASWLYHRAITVMKGVASMGRFVSLDERESFGIEYWPLERYKLTQMPPEKEMTGRVALVTGGASGIGRAAAEGWLAWALTSCSRTSTRTAREAAKEIGNHALAVRMDVTDEASVVGAFRQAVLAFGGVDVAVLSAGIAAASPSRTRASRTGSGCTRSSRPATSCRARSLPRPAASGSGGSLVFVVSKNAMVAGKNNSAYSTAKAAELHRALPGRGGRTPGHPRERGEPGRGDREVGHLGLGVARGAGARPRHRPCGHRGVLPQADDAQEEHHARGRGGGDLLLRLRPDEQADRQHPERRRRCAGGASAVMRKERA